MKNTAHVPTPEASSASNVSGESYSAILRYFYPEFITSLILYSVLNLLDIYFIAQLNVASTYTTLGVTNTLFHFITKIAEGLSVGMVVVCGQYNGVHKYKHVGRAVTDSFWATCVIGGCIASLLYGGAYIIYGFYDVPQEMIELGVPFLRLRAVGVFFHFVYFALIGFLRGIKNTKVPMIFSVIGAVVFIFFDYALVFGKFGFAALEFQGSALASVIQYLVMFIGAFVYVFIEKEHSKYAIKLFTRVRWHNVRDLVHMSWPVVIDKASLAASQIWLTKLMAGVAKANSCVGGATVLESFVAIKDIERFSILPAIALAQVVTFLVSNDYLLQRWHSIKNTIKKTLLLSCSMVFGLFFIFYVSSGKILYVMGKQNVLTPFVVKLLPLVSILVFFDLLQLILSAALRGAGDVKTVMWVRLVVCGSFIPASWVVSFLHFNSSYLQFISIYGSLYVANALMSLLYVYRFKSGAWKKQSIEGS
ncbi:MATE family efflux transporter [Candidatus Dependentiae bacterium]|nr:MATE family efflux transporter [Candidatus Dependentiae bacterium]